VTIISASPCSITEPPVAPLAALIAASTCWTVIPRAASAGGSSTICQASSAPPIVATSDTFGTVSRR
jgi:hypothetical protein